MFSSIYNYFFGSKPDHSNLTAEEKFAKIPSDKIGHKGAIEVSSENVTIKANIAKFNEFMSKAVENNIPAEIKEKMEVFKNNGKAITVKSYNFEDGFNAKIAFINVEDENFNTNQNFVVHTSEGLVMPGFYTPESDSMFLHTGLTEEQSALYQPLATEIIEYLDA